jgi:type IV secretory pathway VirD2 relaxase
MSKDFIYRIKTAAIQRDGSAQVRHLLKKLGNIRSIPRRSRFSGVRGGGSFLPGIYSRREQRSVVKASYAKNTKTRSWAAHGKYLQREHAQEADKKGLGFNQESLAMDIGKTLRDWQSADDPHFFKIIISPDNGDRLDLVQHARALMQQAEKDLSTRLEWLAIDHHNTEHPHVHLLIRGIDENGQSLVLDAHYIAEGFRQRSQQLVTQKLGLRTQLEISLARTRQIDKQRVTEIDRSLRHKAVNGVVRYDTPVSLAPLARERRLQEIKRLKFLETLGLAEQIALKQWRLSDRLEAVLQEMQLAGDIIKSRAQHGYGVTNLQENIQPTLITPEQSLTGRVIGAGLDHELYDRRYLLLEGIDGKIHYVQATESIVKARDSYRLKDNELITLQVATFTPKVDKDSEQLPQPVNYIAVVNHHDLNQLIHAPVSRLDDDVIAFVAEQGRKPTSFAGESALAKEYTQAMINRFAELDRAGLFERQASRIVVKEGWQKHLDDIQHHRVVQEFTHWQLGNANKSIQLVGEVIVSDSRKLLIRDIQDQYYQVRMTDLGITKPPAEKSFVYIRTQQPPGLALSKTDLRLAEMGVYHPEQHRDALLQQQKKNPAFFLKDNEAIDSFVLAHQRRVETWVKWGLYEAKGERYYPVLVADQGNKALIDRMEEKLAEQRLSASRKPAQCTVLTEQRLKAEPLRFTLIDKLLAEKGLPPEKEISHVATRLREQAEFWRSRGVTVNTDFEKSAWDWLAHHSTLEKLEKRLKTTIARPLPEQRHYYSGQVIALGVQDEQGQTHVVIKSSNNQYHAVPVSATYTSTLKVGEDFALNYQGSSPKKLNRKQTIQSSITTDRTIARDTE